MHHKLSVIIAKMLEYFEVHVSVEFDVWRKECDVLMYLTLLFFNSVNNSKRIN
jgi:hypothetical protein